MTRSLPQTIGRYRVLEKLGEGGMGVVYSAHDDRLDRRIAIKTIRSAREGAQRERFWREARAAASVSHPNICAIYEVGEDEHGDLFLAMELLEGEPLSRRLERGPFAPPEAVRTLCEVLSALDALHSRHLIHRDLKPSNVFLTPHGVKLMDFGLARLSASSSVTETGITQTGMVLGTPRYMAPEQVNGRELDGRSDLFAAGLLLYEMLSGRPAHDGETMMQVLHAVVYDKPAPLDSGTLPPGLPAVIDRALAKPPDERFQSAATMADELRRIMSEFATSSQDALGGSSGSGPVVAHTRLAVLPFRLLRPDAEVEFLAFSLPDAVSSALAGLNSLTVRPGSGLPGAGDPPDLGRLAREANVDAVLTGTLLRSGDSVRVMTQLLQAPSGTLIASHQSQAPLGDLFQLQDELTQRIVDALSLPLSSRERRLVHHDIPADPAAYELYLRANQLMNEPRRWGEALELYRQCVGKDQHYAPAWARLGRAARVMAKFGETDRSALHRTAQEAFRRALEINPDLSSAHHLYAYLDVEMGRARLAMVRLIDRARVRRNDPELYGGLVIACRYCGLLEASAAAHDQAIRRDPGARTSVGYTHFFQFDWERCLLAGDAPLFFTRLLGLISLGNVEGAKAHVAEHIERFAGDFMKVAAHGYLAAATGDHAGFLAFVERLKTTPFNDPEALVLVGRSAARMGFPEIALREIGRAINGGHTIPSFLRRDPWLESLQGNPEFERLVADAEKVRAEARQHFLAAGGEQLLGVGTAGPV